MNLPKPSETRRSFVKKVAAGTIVSSLPARSVWGTCQATGVSGGSGSVQIACETPVFCGGWKPDKWNLFKDGCGSRSSSRYSDKLNTMFNMPYTARETDYSNCYDKLKALYENTFIDCGDGSTVPKLSFNLEDCFTMQDNTNCKMEFAAAYLNGYFKLYTWDTTLYPTLEDLLNACWVALCVKHGQLLTADTYGEPDEFEMTSYFATTYDELTKGEFNSIVEIPYGEWSSGRNSHRGH